MLGYVTLRLRVGLSRKVDSMVKRVLVVAGRGSMMDKARTLDAEVWALQRPGATTAHPEGRPGRSLVFDYTRDECIDLVETIHASFPFDAVVSATEDALLPTARINERLGLSGTSVATTVTLLDKSAMRGALSAAGLSPVQTRVCSSHEELTDFGASVGFPFIVKPLAASSSFAIHKVSNISDIQKTAKAFALMGSARYLAEEWLDGPEVSVEVFSFGGRHIVIAVTDKCSDGKFVELGHSIPSKLGSDILGDVIGLVYEFLDCVGLKDGASHTEVKVTDNGPRIVEGHSRRGGDRITEMVKYVYGMDLELATVGWPLGLMTPMEHPPTARGGAAVRFFEAPQGTLLAIEGSHEAAVPKEMMEFHINFKIGDYLDVVRWSLDRPGYVTVFANNNGEAVGIAEKSARTIHFVTDGKLQDREDRLESLASQVDLTTQFS